MRLLDARTLELKSIVGDAPPYAILSHCWDEEEVLFSDLADLERARMKKGFEKLEKTCEKAVKDSLDYVWIDTCCIDKSSSAELSEAINSMFTWYKNSEKCYAYLADVEYPRAIPNSKWFTRAWTLQELLAPSSLQSGERVGMEFFSRHWHSLGSKWALSNAITDITGVPKEYLEGKSLHTASISMRMSWAADRQATRAEDIAYSLLGIFDVNMPLLYGEGKLKAFRRLQEEIMKISEDETLFAWDSMEITADASSSDILASDPKDFSEARHLVPFASDDRLVPYAMTHRGLRIWLQLLKMQMCEEKGREELRSVIRPLRSPVMIWSSQDLVWAILRCHVAHDFHHLVIIPLRYLAADIYLRDTSTNVALMPSDSVVNFTLPEEIYIRNSRIPSISNSIRRRFGFLVRHLPKGFSIASAIPKESWDAKDRILQGNRESSGLGSWQASLHISTNLAVQKDLPTKHMIFISLGCKQDHGDKIPRPWCHLDDTIWFHGGGSLEAFHSSASSKPPRHNVTQFRYSNVTRSDVHLNVSIVPKKVFGQDMFVVDIECERDATNHGISEATVHEKHLDPAEIWKNYTGRDSWAEFATNPMGRSAAQEIDPAMMSAHASERMKTVMKTLFNASSQTKDESLSH
ncbi:Nn.00g090690.m01.CDS01 [Neocucurbitaria sp. VM-36]